MEEKTNYLAHHGVKGMKWGVRRYQNPDGSLIGAKKRKKAARKQYSKDFNRAYNFSSRHPLTQYIKKSKNYSESNRRWDKAYNSAEKYNKAKADYKTAKKEAKDNRKPLLSDKQKKGLMIGAAAVGTALAAYGTYKAAKAVHTKRGMKIVGQYVRTSSTTFTDGTKDFTKSTHYVRKNGSELVKSKTLRKLPNDQGRGILYNTREISKASKNRSSHTVADTLYKYGEMSPGTRFRNVDIKRIKRGKGLVYRR